MISGKFKYGNETITMELGYKLALGKLTDLGLDILSMLEANNPTIQTIMLNDTIMLKVWYHFVNEANAEKWEDALEVLDKQEGGLEPFKKAFWDLVVGFSPPSVQPVLRKAWKHVQKEIQNVDAKLSSSSSSDLSEDLG